MLLTTSCPLCRRCWPRLCYNILPVVIRNLRNWHRQANLSVFVWIKYESWDSPVPDEGTTSLAGEISFGPGAISIGTISRFNGPAYPLYSIRMCLYSGVTNVKYIIISFDWKSNLLIMWEIRIVYKNVVVIAEGKKPIIISSYTGENNIKMEVK